MKKPLSAFLGLALLAGLSLVPQTALAGTSYDFLFSTSSVNDDNQLYLNLAISNYAYPRTVIESESIAADASSTTTRRLPGWLTNPAN